MSIQLIAPPTYRPVSLDELKAHLRIDYSDNDSELKALLDESIKYVEEMTGYRLCTQTWTYKRDRFASKIPIPISPLQSISSITYQDDNNAEQTWAATNYKVDTASVPARLVLAYGGTIPTVYPDLDSVSITLVVGFGQPDKVPEKFKRAIKLYAQWQHDGDEIARKALDIIVVGNKVHGYYESQ